MENLTLYPKEFTAINGSTNSIKIDIALQSFAKRYHYALIYYKDFLDHSERGKLALTKYDTSGCFQNKYEAPIVAFLANIHAMIDSFPFFLFLTLKPLHYIDVDNIKQNMTANKSGWTEDFCNSIKHTYPNAPLLANQFKELMNDEDWKMLKKISNNNKHKFLTRIKNDGALLQFEIISGNNTTYLDVRNFMDRTHDKLLPKIFKFYEQVKLIAS
jgi:hypothetical protein